jgi:hypothetical protein
VSQPHTLFDSQHQDVENDKWDTLITGSATKTHLPNESAKEFIAPYQSLGTFHK